MIDYEYIGALSLIDGFSRRYGSLSETDKQHLADIHSRHIEGNDQNKID